MKTHCLTKVCPHIKLNNNEKRISLVYFLVFCTDSILMNKNKISNRVRSNKLIRDDNIPEINR